MLVGLLVAAWLVVQLAVPTWRLIERGGAPRPRTFGWQMFTHKIQTPAETFVLVTADGRRSVDPTPLLSSPPRREIIYGASVAEALCEEPGALFVEVDDVEHGRSVFPC